MAQEQAKKASKKTEQKSGQETEAVDLRKPALDEDIDAILADIDDVLEVNAEEFVNAFVQKGGQ
jgi:ubiquitin-like protein Pup